MVENVLVKVILTLLMNLAMSAVVAAVRRKGPSLSQVDQAGLKLNINFSTWRPQDEMNALGTAVSFNFTQLMFLFLCAAMK